MEEGLFSFLKYIPLYDVIQLADNNKKLNLPTYRIKAGIFPLRVINVNYVFCYEILKV